MHKCRAMYVWGSNSNASIAQALWTLIVTPTNVLLELSHRLHTMLTLGIINAVFTCTYSILSLKFLRSPWSFSRLSLPTWPPPQYPQRVTCSGSQRSSTGQQKIWRMTLLTQKTHQSLPLLALWPQKRRRDGGRSTKETPAERSWPRPCQSPLVMLLLLTHLLLLCPALGKMKRSLRWIWAPTRKLQHVSQGRSRANARCCSQDLLK